MKLLILTQKVDKNDTVLGFFHRWIEVFSEKFDSITVICLYKGVVDLPTNVKVLSLGKENIKIQNSKFKIKARSQITYIIRFYKYIWSERNNYDSVFIHMNQEYILLGWKIWKLLGKKIYMWRNHHSGSLLTDVAAFFCTKVFCTSKYSYTAKYKKTEFMPVGVDIENFKPDDSVSRIPGSILSLGRIAPSKRPDLLIDAIADLNSSTSTTSQRDDLNKGTENRNIINGTFSVSIYGDALPVDRGYLDSLMTGVSGSRRGLDKIITFHHGVTNTETVSVYSAHDIFVNLSSSGMYDKTIFEAMACGCLILASNDNLRGKIGDRFIFKQGDKEELISKLEVLLNLTSTDRADAVRELMTFAQNHSLLNLADKLSSSIQ